MRKFFTTVLFFILVASPLVAQDNLVYWVHGLNDNRSTLEKDQVWYVYKYTLTKTDNRGTSIQWESTSSLATAADTLNAYISREVSNPGKAIVFGHSAGGLVARQAAKTSGGKIRAVITAGTPNSGAPIITSLKNGSIDKLAVKGLTTIGAAISASLIAYDGSNILRKAFSAILGAETFFMTLLGDVFGVVYIDINKGHYLRKQSVKDMDPDLSKNSFLAGLNASAPTTPIINIYGNEDEKQLVRLSGTLRHKSEVDSYLNVRDSTFDDEAMSVYNNVIANCAEYKAKHQEIANMTQTCSQLLPKLSLTAATNSVAANAWSSAIRYLQYDIHDEWDNIIGATHTESIQEWHQFLFIRWFTFKYVTVYEDSDGFIPNRRSMMKESLGPKTLNREVRGVNHLEMNSHPNMRKMLNRIYRGELGDEFNPEH